MGGGGGGGGAETLLMLYRAIVRSKFDYGCIVYGTASNTNLRQLDSIHNSGLRLALGAFCTSPVSSLYTEANEAPLEERRLKMPMHYYVKTRACIDNQAHHALHEFDRTTRFICSQAKWKRVPSHCGIDGNERVDQLAKETLDQDKDPLASVHYTYIKPLATPTSRSWFKPSGMYMYMAEISILWN